MRYNEQINLKLYTYVNGAFTLQAIIDDYQEISFAHNLYEAGDFTITINYNIPNALKFERGMWIQFGNDSYMFGEIQTITDSIGEDGKGSQVRTITGKDARFIFKRRIIKNLNNEENWAMTAKGEICLRELVKAQCGSGAEAKRQLPITNTIPASSSAIGKEYSVAEAYSNLYDTLVTIATQSEIGWRIKFDGALTLEVYEGSDLSSQVQFSTDFDSLSNGQFTDSAESYANTIYVGGKGTGSDRDIYEGESAIEGESPEGLDRYEAWDNQSSMTSESEYEAEAFSMLTQYGQTLQIAGQGLAKCPYIFKEQYDIGDTITLAFSGKSAKAQILSVTEHWVWGQYGIEFSFGKPQNDLSRQLQLILKQIQKASNKTTATSSVKYYTIPTDTSQPKADVIYDTIGFEGDCGTGATFQLYYDSEKTGAKTYHVWFKQLAGSGKLTLTTGVSGASNLVLNAGTYVAIIYVDADGNVLSQGATATNTIQTGSTQPVTSGAVADEIENVTEIASSLPTDAVLHYSFDDVPDYPDGTADVRLLDNNTYDIQSTNYQLRNNVSSTTFSNVNGNVQAVITGKDNAGCYIRNSEITGKIVKFKIKVTSLVGTLTINSDSRTVSKTITSVGIYDYAEYHFSTATYNNLYIFCQGTGNSCTFELLEIYIGNGSYNTPIIDNSGNGNNATNSGALAIQGVSGKGIFFLENAQKKIPVSVYFIRNYNKWSISLWVNLREGQQATGQNPRIYQFGNFDYCFISNFYKGYSGADRYIRFYTYYGTGNYVRVDTTSIEQFIGQIIHITVVNEIDLSGTSKKTIYINGKENVTVSTTALTQRPTLNDAYIGGTVATNQFLENSMIDDFQIFNRALSEQEVVALYLNKANTPKYYNLNNYEIENADTTPTQNSINLIKSGGVYSALQNYQSKNFVTLSSNDANIVDKGIYNCYRVGSGCANIPVAKIGLLTSYKYVDGQYIRITQEYSTNDTMVAEGEKYIRFGYSNNDGTSYTWSDWQKIETSKDLASYSNFLKFSVSANGGTKNLVDYIPMGSTIENYLMIVTVLGLSSSKVYFGLVQMNIYNSNSNYYVTQLVNAGSFNLTIASGTNNGTITNNESCNAEVVLVKIR